MHFLVAPTDRPGARLHPGRHHRRHGRLFADPAVRRVVVEPDVPNTAVHALNAAVGFDRVGTIRKPEKDALLSVCTRDRFVAAARGDLTA